MQNKRVVIVQRRGGSDRVGDEANVRLVPSGRGKTATLELLAYGIDRMRQTVAAIRVKARGTRASKGGQIGGPRRKIRGYTPASRGEVSGSHLGRGAGSHATAQRQALALPSEFSDTHLPWVVGSQPAQVETAPRPVVPEAEKTVPEGLGDMGPWSSRRGRRLTFTSSCTGAAVGPRSHGKSASNGFRRPGRQSWATGSHNRLILAPERR